MGNLLGAVNSQFPPKAKWTIDDAPDLTGKVKPPLISSLTCRSLVLQEVTEVLVNDSPTALIAQLDGFKALLQHGAKVCIAGRSEEKAKEAILQGASDRRRIWIAYVAYLDLADIPSISKAA